MKLKDLTEKQVVQTTEKNHESFMKLLDKEGFKWCDGDSYLKDIEANKYKKDRAYNVKKGSFDFIENWIDEGKEIIQASKFLKPTKKELLERIERLEESVKEPIISFYAKPYEVVNKASEPKAGDLCAFADDEKNFDTKDLIIRKLHCCKTSTENYIDELGVVWRYARKVEIKFL